MVIPGPITNTGVKISHGQTAGWLGSSYEPFHLNDDPASPGFDAGQLLDRARRFLDRAVNQTPAFGRSLAALNEPLLTSRARTHSIFTPSPSPAGTHTGQARSVKAACWSQARPIGRSPCDCEHV